MLHFRRETSDHAYPWMLPFLALPAMFAATLLAQVTGTRGQAGPPLPDGPGKDITHKV